VTEERRKVEWDNIGRYFLDPAMPPELRRAIEPILVKWRGLIPSWCERIDLMWNDEDRNGAAFSVAHYDYRRGHINVLPNWLTRPDRRESMIVHETIHFLTEPVHNVLTDFWKFMEQHHPETKGLFEELVRHANEQVTVDLTRAFLLAGPPRVVEHHPTTTERSTQ
jgi:hypothetical protein